MTDCVRVAQPMNVSTAELLTKLADVAAKRRYEEAWRFDEDDPLGSDLGPWEDLDSEDRAAWTSEAVLDFAAALGVCDVRKEWGHDDVWHSHQCPDSAMWRLVIQTPAIVHVGKVPTDEEGVQ